MDRTGRINLSTANGRNERDFILVTQEEVVLLVFFVDCDHQA